MSLKKIATALMWPMIIIFGLAFWIGVWSCCNAADRTFSTKGITCPNVEDHGASITQRQMDVVCAAVIAEARAGTLSGFHECAVVAQQAMLAQGIPSDTVYKDRHTRGTGIALCHALTKPPAAVTSAELESP